MNKKCMIFGVTGQDGSYLAELLLDKGYKVYGIIRRSSSFNTKRIEHIFNNPNLELIYGDLSDSSNINKIIRKILPDEIYNLAAQSHVRVSFDIPEYTANVTGLGTLRILEAIRNLKEEGIKDIKFYQASSSEMYGKVIESPQTEETPFYPRSPYGVAKVFSYWMVRNYRESYGLHASNGILFNHESPRRGETFVTRKIIKGVLNIVKGRQDCLHLGNLSAKRDWGHARDYVEAMWLMLQQDKPDDYVIATGKTMSVRDFLLSTFECFGVEIVSNGKEGLEEEYRIKGKTEPVVKIDERYFRPTEVDLLLGNPSKAKEKLGWTPTTTVQELISEMINGDKDD